MYLGIEIGGTKLQLGIGDGAGVLLRSWRGTVDVSAGATGIRQRILAEIPVLLDQANLQRDDIHRVGIGFGGPVDLTTQRIITSHQIEGWTDFPICEWLECACRWPVTVGNDADVAGLAEAHLGAGRGQSPVFYITIGSGIGGGLIIDGQIYRGAGRGAAEIGHLRFPSPDDPAAEWVTLESLASGWGIGKRARRLPGIPVTMDAVGVANAARCGEAWAMTLLEQTASYLADALCHVIALLCPRRIVIGGGVSLIGDRLFTPLRQFVAERAFRPFQGLTEIVPAELGEWVVVHGALVLARCASDA